MNALLVFQTVWLLAGGIFLFGLEHVSSLMVILSIIFLLGPSIGAAIVIFLDDDRDHIENFDMFLSNFDDIDEATNTARREWIQNNLDILQDHKNRFVAVDIEEDKIVLSCSSERRFVKALSAVNTNKVDKLLIFHTSVVL